MITGKFTQPLAGVLLLAWLAGVSGGCVMSRGDPESAGQGTGGPPTGIAAAAQESEGVSGSRVQSPRARDEQVDLPADSAADKKKATASLVFGRVAGTEGAAPEERLAIVRQQLQFMASLGADRLIIFSPLHLAPAVHDIVRELSLPATVVHGGAQLGGYDLAACYLVVPGQETRARGTDELEGALEQALRTLPAGREVVLATTLDRDEIMRDSRWGNIQQLLMRQRRSATVVAGGGPVFSAWSEGRIRFLALGPIAKDSSEDEGDVLRGNFAGVLWSVLNAGRDGLVHRVLRRDAVLTPGAVQYSDQKMVAALVESLQATPVDEFNPVTKVSFVNAIEQTLEFAADWQFARTGGEVLPKIRGFTLGPGDKFQQEFRFQANNAQDIRTLRPELQLKTTFESETGRQVPIRLTATPWPRVAAELVKLAAPPEIDGNPQEWAGASLAIDHLGQVMTRRDAWAGPEDASASVRVGQHGEEMYFGVTVRDDRVQLPLGGDGARQSSDRVRLFFLPASRAHRDNGMVSPAVTPVEITVLPDGHYRVSGAEAENGMSIRVAVAYLQDGYGVEIALPASLIPRYQQTGQFLLELVIEDVDERSDRPTTLYLSGRPDEIGMPVPELFGLFVQDVAQIINTQ